MTKSQITVHAAEAVAEYLNRGKTITVCKPVNAKGVRLWNPGNDVLREQRRAKRFLKNVQVA